MRGRHGAVGAAGRPALRKMVTQEASFAVYAPQGWRATESTGQSDRTLYVSDPQGRFGVIFSYGRSPGGGNAVAVGRGLVSQFRRTFPDLRISGARGVSPKW